jgi:hypothetical protein
MFWNLVSASVVVVCLEMWLQLFFKVFFCAEMYQYDIFFIFLKIIFEISASKRSKTYKKIKFLKNTICTAFSYSVLMQGGTMFN